MATVDMNFTAAGKFRGTFSDKKLNDFSDFKTGDVILFIFTPTDGGPFFNHYEMIVRESDIDLIHQVAHLKEVVLNITLTPKQVPIDGFDELFHPVHVIPFAAFKSNNAVCQPGMGPIFFLEYFTIEGADGTISPRIVFSDDQILHLNDRFFATSQGKNFTLGLDGRESLSVERNAGIARCIESLGDSSFQSSQHAYLLFGMRFSYILRDALRRAGMVQNAHKRKHVSIHLDVSPVVIHRFFSQFSVKFFSTDFSSTRREYLCSPFQILPIDQPRKLIVFKPPNILDKRLTRTFGNQYWFTLVYNEVGFSQRFLDFSENGTHANISLEHIDFCDAVFSYDVNRGILSFSSTCTTRIPRKDCFESLEDSFRIQRRAGIGYVDDDDSAPAYGDCYRAECVGQDFILEDAGK
jgi:hypothetical protein